MNCKDYEVVKGTSITGVMLTFIATVLLLVFLTCKKSRAFASLVFIIAGLGGALGIIQVITYSKIQKGYADDPYFRDTDYGYSFIVGTMGGIMTCLAAILTLVSCCKFSSTSDDEAMLKIDVPGVTSPQGYGNAAQPNSSWA